uniref:ORFIII n=1 Tax=Pseudomonas aeruginosa TaxID=287 RepID=L0BB15_PSEAI|nr:hypothetical protein [Pseudomonas aeruginosa]AGC74793.1 ORFIII [Pseudomonas aeruginosa]
MFRPSPCPAHYGRHLATMPSADLCLITHRVAPVRAIGFHRFGSFQLMRLKSPGTYRPEPDWLADRSLVKQISPDKRMNFHCTAASFTVAVRSPGFVVLCQLASSLRLV